MFDPEKFGEAMGKAIHDAVAPLREQIKGLELQIPLDIAGLVEMAVSAAVAKMPIPKDGKDAEAIDKAALVKEVLALIPAPEAGKDGAPGRDGASVTLADVRPMLEEVVTSVRSDAAKAIDEAVKAQRAPQDGKDGANGAPGKDGADGAKGADGLGLAGAMIDRTGALQITLTNGEVKSLGVVVGRDGSNGADGLSLDGFEMEYLPESHEIAVKATAAGRVKELRYPAGGIRPAGYWREGTKAQSGEAWVHDGSLWIAKAATAAKPESRSEDWIIAARKGRDGERGQKGADANPPAPIKLQG